MQFMRNRTCVWFSSIYLARDVHQMAKDSNKRAVLAKRKLELEHAIRHDFSDSIIAKRVEKVRFAALKLIKKDLGQNYTMPLDGIPLQPESSRYMDWFRLAEKWNSLASSEIVELVKQWPDNPSVRDLGHYRA